MFTFVSISVIQQRVVRAKKIDLLPRDVAAVDQRLGEVALLRVRGEVVRGDGRRRARTREEVDRRPRTLLTRSTPGRAPVHPVDPVGRVGSGSISD